MEGNKMDENPQEPEIVEPEAKPKKVAAVKKGPVIMPHTARARAAVLEKLKNK